MLRALKLAAQGLGLTSPNPCVGAVLWRDGRVIGEGFHRKAGLPHAEVEAVRDARGKGRRIEGATLYVTLEPCSTVGRTPACTDLIVREKIARVVVGAADPNPRHAGAAFPILRRAGVKVSSGLFAAESAHLNRAFNRWIATSRPWVTAKIALSLDGRIETRPGDDRWITGPEARRAAHELRLESDAILVGGETVRRDDPKLTVRIPGLEGKLQPLRIVRTREGKFPPGLALFTDRFRDRTRLARGRSLEKILKGLGKEGVTHLLIEGGGGVLAEAFGAGVVDEVAFFLAPVLLGTEVRAIGALGGKSRNLRLKDPVWQRVGNDLFCRALV